jgi:hypothetical protein
MAREAHGRRRLLVLEREWSQAQDVRCNVVVTDDVVELKTVELVLELVDY